MELNRLYFALIIVHLDFPFLLLLLLLLLISLHLVTFVGHNSISFRLSVRPDLRRPFRAK